MVSYRLNVAGLVSGLTAFQFSFSEEKDGRQSNLNQETTPGIRVMRGRNQTTNLGPIQNEG